MLILYDFLIQFSSSHNNRVVFALSPFSLSQTPKKKEGEKLSHHASNIARVGSILRATATLLARLSRRKPEVRVVVLQRHCAPEVGASPCAEIHHLVLSVPIIFGVHV